MANNEAWLLLLYKVPPEPSARRVYVWRKLKRLGALLMHDAAWVLPDTPHTRERLQWLAAEISEMGGDALLWQSHLTLAAQSEALVQRFVDQAEAAYQPIRAELERADRDLAALSQQYQQAREKDYFKSKLGRELYRLLLDAQEDKDQ
jgi:hypothetical protein